MPILCTHLGGFQILKKSYFQNRDDCDVVVVDSRAVEDDGKGKDRKVKSIVECGEQSNSE